MGGGEGGPPGRGAGRRDLPRPRQVAAAPDLRKVLDNPATQQRLLAAGLVVDNQPRDEWIAFTRKTLVTWGEVARRNNIKVQ